VPTPARANPRSGCLPYPLSCARLPGMWEWLKEFVYNRALLFVLGSVIGFFFRSLWQHQLSKRIDDYRNELAQQLERFKASLASELFKKQWIHSERSKVLVKLHPLLVLLDGECSRALVYMSWATKGQLPIDTAGAAFELANQKLTEFFAFLTENGALLGPELGEQLRTLAKKYQKILGVAPYDGAPSESESSLTVIEHFERMKSDTAPLLKEILETIQKMLGAE
jgi:hypothetical protein